MAVLVLVAFACGRSGFIADGDGPEADDDDDDAAPPYYGSGDDGSVAVHVGTNLNPCLAVAGVAGSALQVQGVTDPFEAGDLLFLWQVQAPIPFSIGDTASELVTTTAGTWELARASAVLATALELADPPSFAYRSGADYRAQVCRVPEFQDVTIGTAGEIGGQDWNGETGAFVGFVADGVVTIDGEVEIGGDGFNGGVQVAGGIAPDTEDEETMPVAGGAKGEGIDRRAFGGYGRGQLANAGGGGNAQNAGGAGGGGGGSGGYGGGQQESLGVNPETAGRGGRALPAMLPGRLYPGGGGGAGHDDNGTGANGASGGGVLLIVAREIAGNGRILAIGERPPDSASDGGSGGGGGGTVVLYAESGAFGGTISVRGGDGAHSVFPSDRRGPGGGGGGGRIAIGGAPFAAMSVNTSGGSSGLTGPLTDDPWGAQPGQPGIRVELAEPLPIPTPPPPPTPSL